MRLYLDSNVFISLVREEIDSSFNLLGTDSENFFIWARKAGSTMLVSRMFLDEIFHVLSLPEKAVFEELECFMLNLETCKKAPSEALVLKISRNCGLHWADSAHVAYAVENNADKIVTWNLKDFKKAESFVRCVSPAHFL
ncbi:MAG: PIN domain-containing protein [Candidatus Diapherotrites archaeon]|nr:PIN domain-containing protein [Candidatus Diapherotrites archaeon]